jgi:hypothetical protein
MTKLQQVNKIVIKMLNKHGRSLFPSVVAAAAAAGDFFH